LSTAVDSPGIAFAFIAGLSPEELLPELLPEELLPELLPLELLPGLLPPAESKSARKSSVLESVLDSVLLSVLNSLLSVPQSLAALSQGSGDSSLPPHPLSVPILACKAFMESRARARSLVPGLSKSPCDDDVFELLLLVFFDTFLLLSIAPAATAATCLAVKFFGFFLR
jgi:hypothetical protein